ncbi:MAG: hypothetical protein LBC97_13485 [Bifidobacteriaceae bacterium]|nr:hypothetical protein [Bifidobacteriaceae bacterium]
MKIKVAVGQLAPTEDAAANWEAAMRLAEQAAQGGARLLVLPEQTMLAQRGEDAAHFAALVAPAWDWWPQAVRDAARRLDLAIVAGGFAPFGAPMAPCWHGGCPDSAGRAADPAAKAPDAAGRSWDGRPGFPAMANAGTAEDSEAHGRADSPGGAGATPDGPEGTRPWNVLLAWDPADGIIAVQAKTRLYDAFGGRESAMVRPGEAGMVRPVRLAGLTLGLVNCYELRFPEHARQLARAGAEILTLSAAWARGPLKEDQWATLARARAIENCAYLLAAGTRAKDTIGRSMIIDPAGIIRAGLADEPEGLAIAEIDTDLVAATRARVGSVPAANPRAQAR